MSCKLILAPMQGLCDPVMRDLLTRIGGYDECVSEFVRITHTVHSRPTWLRHVPEIASGNRTAAGTPCTVQILGSDENMMAANGDVFTLADYLAIREQSGCDIVMLGRGAVIRPDLARQIKRHETGEPVGEAGFDSEIRGWIRQFFALCEAKEGEGRYASARLKQWLGMMRQAYPEAEALFAIVRPLKTHAEVRAAIAA